MIWAGRRRGVAGRPLTGRELPHRPWPYRVLVLGGARSGKSVTAERLLARRDRVDYVATGARPDDSDPEWAARVRLHQQRRLAHKLQVREQGRSQTSTPPAGRPQARVTRRLQLDGQ